MHGCRSLWPTLRSKEVKLSPIGLHDCVFCILSSTFIFQRTLFLGIICSKYLIQFWGLTLLIVSQDKYCKKKMWHMLDSIVQPLNKKTLTTNWAIKASDMRKSKEMCVYIYIYIYIYIYYMYYIILYIYIYIYIYILYVLYIICI